MWHGEIIIYLYSPVILLVNPFAFTTALILCDTDLARDFGPQWHDYTLMASPILPHPKGSSLDWDLVAVEAICVQL